MRDHEVFEVQRSLKGPSSAVFDAVSSGTPCAVVPQQNSTFGSVIETYDNLRRLAVGSTVFIRGETTMYIQHCLVVRPGVKQEEITRIVSHEQVCCRAASPEPDA